MPVELAYLDRLVAAVERNHSIRGYLMDSGKMVYDGQQRGSKLRNEADTDAIALYVVDTIDWRDFRFTPKWNRSRW